MSREQVIVDIEGMSCSSCVAHVRAALASIVGVEIADATVGRAVITLAGQAGDKDLRAVIESAGYSIRQIRRKDAGLPHGLTDASGATGPAAACCCGGAHTTATQIAGRRRQPSAT